MGKLNDGGPAFARPATIERGYQPSYAQSGMTLRDYFAGQALAGIVGPKAEGFSLSEGACAKWAYDYADAMLKAREAVQ